eukprot:8256376-Pyramimonas_sp.AAC.1
MTSTHFAEEMKRRSTGRHTRSAPARSFRRAARGHAATSSSRHGRAAGARRHHGEFRLHASTCRYCRQEPRPYGQ